jgi:hypothetical protein
MHKVGKIQSQINLATLFELPPKWTFGGCSCIDHHWESRWNINSSLWPMFKSAEGIKNVTWLQQIAVTCTAVVKENQYWSKI